jgi:hypothetical protein
MRRNNEKKKQYKKKFNGKKRVSDVPRVPQKAIETCRIRSMVSADNTIVALRYTEPVISILNAGGLQFALKTYRANDAWDPDPALASGTVTGFREWASLYSHWKVESCTVESTLVNTTSGNIIHAFWLWTVEAPTITNVAQAIDASELANATRISSQTPIGTNASVARWRTSKNLAELYGNREQYIGRSEYAGIGTDTPSSPAFKQFVTLVAYSSNPWSVTLDALTRLTYVVSFYGRYAVQQ